MRVARIISDLTEQYMDDDALIEAYCRKEGSSAEEVILAKERMQGLCDLFKELYKQLSHSDFNVLIKWLIEGRTMVDIGKMKHNTAATAKSKYAAQNFNQAGMRETRRIAKVLRKLALNPNVISLKPLLTQEFEKDATPPMNYGGWLVERLERANTDASWSKPTKTCHVKSEYKTRYHCRIPEYLHKSFGDNIPTCTMCGKRCTRKTEFN